MLQIGLEILVDIFGERSDILGIGGGSVQERRVIVEGERYKRNDLILEHRPTPEGYIRWDIVEREISAIESELIGAIELRI